MKNKVIILSGLFMSSCYTNTVVQLPTPDNSVKPSAVSTNTPSVIPTLQSTPTSIPSDKIIDSGLKNDIKPTPVPSPTPYMCVGAGAIKDVNGNRIQPASGQSCWNPDDLKPSPPPYSNNQPIPSNYDHEGLIYVAFKDGYKIRPRDHEARNANAKLKLQYEMENKPLSIYFPEALKPEFTQVRDLVSLSGADTSQLNSLLSQYNITVIQAAYTIMSQEQADKNEKIMESIYPNQDFVNRYSEYTLKYKNIDLVSFLNELRELNIVREANYSDNSIGY